MRLIKSEKEDFDIKSPQNTVAGYGNVSRLDVVKEMRIKHDSKLKPSSKQIESKNNFVGSSNNNLVQMNGKEKSVRNLQIIPSGRNLQITPSGRTLNKINIPYISSNRDIDKKTSFLLSPDVSPSKRSSFRDANY